MSVTELSEASARQAELLARVSRGVVQARSYRVRVSEGVAGGEDRQALDGPNAPAVALFTSLGDVL